MKARRARRPNSKRLVNELIVYYLKSREFLIWTGDTIDLETEIIPKLNAMAEDSEIEGEQYEVRNCRGANEMKYVHVRCARRKCRFNVWFIKTERGNLVFHRASYVSHCPEEHQNLPPLDEEQEQAEPEAAQQAESQAE